MYIVAHVLNSFTGERSVCKVLVQKGHLCFMDSLTACEDDDERLNRQDFRATASETCLNTRSRWILQRTDARTHSMKKEPIGRHDNNTQRPGLGKRPTSAGPFRVSSQLPSVRLVVCCAVLGTEPRAPHKCSTIEPQPLTPGCEYLIPVLFNS